MDPSAYTTSDVWYKILNELKLDEVAIRDNRYDCVVHLVTAAKGADQFYSLENNTQRTEGVELAKSLDDLVMKAWMGHPSFQVVDNYSVKNFQEKKNRVVQAVMSRLGLAESSRYGGSIKKHKYLVKNYDYNSKNFPVEFRDFQVEHIYLMNPGDDGVQIRIRKREESNSAVIHMNIATRNPEINGQRIETRRTLSPREYETLRVQADPTRYPIKKHRRCFLWMDRYYQLDSFLDPHAGLVLMEAYLEVDPVGVDTVALPDWLEFDQVTNDKQYSMFELSKKF
ncbi:hypothetical protein HK096_010957 [Nowakowskiella sp. JEL0078]|nr:hypothetical protein HK096_010957 [Nowakowskiella sp. JEL0078]